MPYTTISAIRRALATQGPQIQAMATLLVTARRLPKSAAEAPRPLPDPEGTVKIVSLLPVVYGRPLALLDLARKRLPMSNTYIVLVRWKRSGLLGTVQLHRTALSPEAWSVSSLSVADSAVALHAVVSHGRASSSNSNWIFVCSPLRFQALVCPNSPKHTVRARVIQSGITDLRRGPWFGISGLAQSLALVDHRLQRAAAAAGRRTIPTTRPVGKGKRPQRPSV